MVGKVKHIVFLVIPDATLLDITGPYEVFSQLLEYCTVNSKETGFIYRLHSVTIDKRKNVRTASGIIIRCEENIRSINYPIDTLIVPGIPNSQVGKYMLPRSVLRWIAIQSETVRRLCSVCTGSFFLAEAGILDNKKATTHWAKCIDLNKGYPHVRVENDPIFIKDNNIYTSAGISSGMDLALALVEEDLGKPLALKVARQMVLFLKRPGSQSQYSSVLAYQRTDYQPIQEICNWIVENLHHPLTVETLSEKVSMSLRNFARVFVREMQITPAKYIEKLRVEAACRYLADSRLSLKEIAELCGLGSPDNMRKVFIKQIKISPADYRKGFVTSLS